MKKMNNKFLKDKKPQDKNFCVNSFFPKSREGGEKIFAIWEISVFAIIGLGIVIGVVILYFADVDVREIESSVLYNKVADCVVKQGYVIDRIFNDDFDIFKECEINKETINSGDFYFKVELLDEGWKNLTKEIRRGSMNFDADCKVAKKVKAEKYPKCTEKKEDVVYYKNNEEKIATLYILTASNQEGKVIPAIK